MINHADPRIGGYVHRNCALLLGPDVCVGRVQQVGGEGTIPYLGINPWSLTFHTFVDTSPFVALLGPGDERLTNVAEQDFMVSQAAYVTTAVMSIAMRLKQIIV